MEWDEAEFGYEQDPRIRFEVRCRESDKEWVFKDEEAAEEHKEEHSEYTDHEIKLPVSREHLTLESEVRTEPDSIVHMIRELEDESSEPGMEEEKIFAFFVGDGAKIAEVKHSLDKLKAKGVVYEPKQGRIVRT